MEKLIELINKYKEEKNIFNTDMDWQLEIWKYIYVNYPCAERLCSKKYWFIEQLIKRDEINLNDSDLLTLSSELWCAVNSDIVIMVLSIKGNPLEYLCSILKE